MAAYSRLVDRVSCPREEDAKPLPLQTSMKRHMFTIALRLVVSTPEEQRARPVQCPRNLQSIALSLACYNKKRNPLDGWTRRTRSYTTANKADSQLMCVTPSKNAAGVVLPQHPGRFDVIKSPRRVNVPTVVGAVTTTCSIWR